MKGAFRCILRPIKQSVERRGGRVKRPFRPGFRRRFLWPTAKSGVRGRRLFFKERRPSDGIVKFEKMRLVVAGHDDNAGGRMFGPEICRRLKTFNTEQIHIHGDPVRFEFAGARQGFIAGRALAKGDARQVEKLADHFPRAGLLVNNH